MCSRPTSSSRTRPCESPIPRFPCHQALLGRSPLGWFGGDNRQTGWCEVHGRPSKKKPRSEISLRGRTSTPAEHIQALDLGRRLALPCSKTNLTIGYCYDRAKMSPSQFLGDPFALFLHSHNPPCLPQEPINPHQKSAHQTRRNGAAEPQHRLRQKSQRSRTTGACSHPTPIKTFRVGRRPPFRPCESMPCKA